MKIAGRNVGTKLIALFAACLMAGGANAEDSSQDELGKRLVNDFLTKVATLEGEFEQSLIDADGILLERNTGMLEIERPSRFRWSYIEPYEQWLIADGMNIWSYDIDLEQVTVKPQVEALANTPALLLGGAEDALEQFDLAGTTIDTETTWVRLVPKNTDSGFKRVELGFIDGELQRMVFFDNLEQTTLVALYNLRVNEPIDASRFEFTVPIDVDLVGTPAVAGITVP